MMKIFIAFVVLTSLLTAALIYMYYVRRSVHYEGFSEEDIRVAEKTVAQAIPGLDQPTIARVLGIIQRMSAIVLTPSFFSNAVRQSGMSPIDLAREYIKSQKAK